MIPVSFTYEMYRSPKTPTQWTRWTRCVFITSPTKTRQTITSSTMCFRVHLILYLCIAKCFLYPWYLSLSLFLRIRSIQMKFERIRHQINGPLNSSIDITVLVRWEECSHFKNGCNIIVRTIIAAKYTHRNSKRNMHFSFQFWIDLSIFNSFVNYLYSFNSVYLIQMRFVNTTRIRSLLWAIIHTSLTRWMPSSHICNTLWIQSF